MKTTQIGNILSKIKLVSKWELDSVVYYDRTYNPKTLFDFLTRIQELQKLKGLATPAEKDELAILLEFLNDLNEEECLELLDRTDEDDKIAFIENLARMSAIEILTGEKISFETMNTACKLSPSDFILCAKRTQDLINAIHGLVIKGETLSKDVAGT
jgi:hypothetical protein